MQETWRWFGPDDPISLESIKQAGATGVVTSLHDVPTGEVWKLEDVLERKGIIETAGLTWSVIESIPVHNDIKTRTGNCQEYTEKYIESLKNVGEAGVSVVCYNFMPVVDWTRTNLMYKLPNESHALRFEMTDFAAYDVYILQRKGAQASYSDEVLVRAKQRFNAFTNAEKKMLETNIIAGLPGGYGSYTRAEILAAIEEFIELGESGFRDNLFAFLSDVIPAAEQAGVRMCTHPDDPPFSLFGLPRIVSTADDARALLAAVPSESNGLTLCAGSYGSRGDNNLVEMIKEFGDRVYFVHLRNVKREEDGSFFEAEHLDGDNDMVGLIDALLKVEASRKAKGDSDYVIPMRPDHGHLMGDEINLSDVKPGYSPGRVAWCDSRS